MDGDDVPVLDDLDVAFKAVTAGANVVLRAFHDLADVNQQVKGDGSVVTAADRDAEQAAREVPAEWGSQDAVVGEELRAT